MPRPPGQESVSPEEEALAIPGATPREDDALLANVYHLPGDRKHCPPAYILV